MLYNSITNIIMPLVTPPGPPFQELRSNVASPASRLRWSTVRLKPLELCFAARCRENSHGFSSPRSCQGADNPWKILLKCPKSTKIAF